MNIQNKQELLDVIFQKENIDLVTELRDIALQASIYRKNDGNVLYFSNYNHQIEKIKSILLVCYFNEYDKKLEEMWISDIDLNDEWSTWHSKSRIVLFKSIHVGNNKSPYQLKDMECELTMFSSSHGDMLEKAGVNEFEILRKNRFLFQSNRYSKDYNIVLEVDEFIDLFTSCKFNPEKTQAYIDEVFLQNCQKLEKEYNKTREEIIQSLTDLKKDCIELQKHLSQTPILVFDKTYEKSNPPLMELKYIGITTPHVFKFNDPGVQPIDNMQKVVKKYSIPRPSVMKTQYLMSFNDESKYKKKYILCPSALLQEGVILSDICYGIPLIPEEFEKLIQEKKILQIKKHHRESAISYAEHTILFTIDEFKKINFE